jgi:hypothetical protein
VLRENRRYRISSDSLFELQGDPGARESSAASGTGDKGARGAHRAPRVRRPQERERERRARWLALNRT